MTWLHAVLGPDAPAFALLHRPDSSADSIDLITGEMLELSHLADLPVRVGRPIGGSSTDLLALVPYRQIAERGFACRDDGAPLLVLRARHRQSVPLGDVMRVMPEVTTTLRDADFDITDDEYADIVRGIIAHEIGTGAGANFVIKRSLLAHIDGYAEQPRRHALAVFGRLLAAEAGAHWTFLVHTGASTLIGASPERHVTLAGGVATMNPISGTFRYPPGQPDMVASQGFLGDSKEIDELFMVLDEELKMMGRVCRGGGRVTGPRIRPMARLAHTEYFIAGNTNLDVRRILHETMFAPTVTGSPLESACRVIDRYERRGRRYYAGALALVGRDGAGRQVLDSTIVIRTAEIDRLGRVRIDVGATLVRHSDPASEAAETRAKAESLRAAFDGRHAVAPGAAGWHNPDFWTRPEITRALAARNERLATFWLQPQHERSRAVPALLGHRALVIDCEDNFTAMLGHQLTALGIDVTIRRFDTDYTIDSYDLIVVGPGPGDPRAVADRKIATMRQAISEVLDEGRPLLAVCLGHQVLAHLLGLALRRLPVPNQGSQHEIEMFGRREWCGFYNTFAAYAPADWVAAPVPGGKVRLARDPATGAVHAIRGECFRSLQFHAESVLTRHGVDLLGWMCTELLGTGPPPNATATQPGAAGADRPLLAVL